MEEFTAETERKGRDCASLLIDWMQPCHRAIGSHVANCEFILGELSYTRAGGNNILLVCGLGRVSLNISFGKRRR